MTLQSTYPIAIYANGLFQDGYPNPPVPYAVQAAQLNMGITSVLLWSIHIHAGGDLYLNDSPFVSNGEIQYSTDATKGENPDFPMLIKALTVSGGSVRDLIASVGSWGGYSDFTNWYANRSAVKQNLSALKTAFGITGVDFDFEPENGYTALDQTMIVDLTLDVGAIGMFATYCPYTQPAWWVGCLSSVYQKNGATQIVRWMNLQCYAGGGGNTPQPWAAAVAAAGNIGIANPQAFIVPGYAVAGAEGDGMCPSEMQGVFAGFGGSGTTGGFLWNSGAIWNAEGAGKPLCGGVVATPADYAAAISNGLAAPTTGTAALASGARALTTTATGLTVEIVNDSDRTDEQVYLLLTGTSVAVSGEITSLQLPQSTTGSITAGALNGLASNGTLVSPYTGQTRTIYQFGVNTLVSGRLLVSFDDAITYADNDAPTATNQTMRWDKLEFGYPGSGADLTSIDFFGIPLQFDYLDASGNVLNTMTYYTSTPTFLSALYNLQAPAMANAFQQYANKELSFGWTPGTDNLSNFVRVVGPQTLTAGSGSAAPYPSFKPYLDTLVSSGESYTISGSAGVGAPAPANNNVTYDYTGSFASDNQSGYTLTLSGTMTGTPYGLYTDSNGVTTSMALPAGLPVALALPAGAYDNNIYSAQADAFTVGQSSDPSGANYIAPTLARYTKNSPYATIAGDLIAGLNFGYPDGNYGTSSAGWYSNPPTPYPFGAARSTNDGYYNPFAAVLYNLSDAYGFPFSDRNGRPSPYVPLPANAVTMRVTILNDNRLDAPQVTLDQINDTTITLNWPAITVPAGFILTGYNVVVSPPYPGWVDNGPADTTTVTFGALQAGTQYSFSVTAIGTANGQTVQSYTTQVSAATGGTAASLNGGYTFLTTLNWSAPAPQPADATFTIGGNSYTPGGAPASVGGSAGSNVFPLIVSAGGNTIYEGNYVVNLVADGSGYNVGPSGCALVGNGQPLSQAGPSGTPPYQSSSGSQLVIGTPFAPVPGKDAAPVVFPA